MTDIHLRSASSWALAIIVFAFALGAGRDAVGAEPSFRYCEAGLNYENFSAKYERLFSSVGFALRGGYEEGFGYRVGCKIELTDWVYGFGDYSQAKPDAFAQFENSMTGQNIVQSIDDGDVERWRVGFGVFREVAPNLTGYAQLGVSRLKLLSAGQPRIICAFSCTPPSRKIRRTHIDAKIGARWMALPGLEIGGFGRYDGAGGVRVTDVSVGGNSANSFVRVEPKDEFRGGVNVALRISGPAWLSARYEIGKTQIVFTGLRIVF